MGTDSGVLRQIGKLPQQGGPILPRLAPCPGCRRSTPGCRRLDLRQGVQAVLVGPGGDDLAIELRGVQVVVVVVQARHP